MSSSDVLNSVKMKRKKETIRRSAPYESWRTIAEYFETKPEIPEILRYLYGLGMLRTGPPSGNAIEQLIRDKYPGFAMIERLGDEKDGGEKCGVCCRKAELSGEVSEDRELVVVDEDRQLVIALNKGDKLCSKCYTSLTYYRRVKIPTGKL